MRISVPNKEKQPNCFLFNDDEENRVYVEGNLKKTELVNVFLDEYNKLVEEREGEYSWFYDELEEILKSKWITIKSDLLSINYN